MIVRLAAAFVSSSQWRASIQPNTAVACIFSCPPNPFEAIGCAAARFHPATVPSSGTPTLDLEICGKLPPMKRGSEGLVISDPLSEIWRVPEVSARSCAWKSAAWKRFFQTFLRPRRCRRSCVTAHSLVFSWRSLLRPLSPVLPR